MSMGRLKASMPTKCMAQIPMPIANAPPDNQYRAAGRPLAARTRFAMPNAVYDARTATPRDTRTSEGLYVPTSIFGVLSWAHTAAAPASIHINS